MSDDLERVGGLVEGAMGRRMPLERRIAWEWPKVVGEEIARNAQPRSLRRGRLVVATSSSVWAQTLQLMEDQVKRGLNRALAVSAVEEVVFRPAGWDPGAGAGGPRALGAPGAREDLARQVEATDGTGEAAQGRSPPRRLTADEERAVDEVRRLACDEVLGEQIARAMRAYLERQSR